MAESIEPFPGPFPGTIKAGLDVPGLLQVSDLVCSGFAEEVQDEHEVRYMVQQEALTFIREVAQFRVVEVYAGDLEANTNTIQIEFLRADLPTSLESLHAGDAAIVFLVRDRSRFRFANLTTSKILLGRAAPSGTALREVGLARLRDVLERATRSSEPDIAATAREALASMEEDPHAPG